MPRPLRYTLIGLLWAAVAGYIVYSAARVRTHRRQLVVQRLDIEIADSSSHGQLVTGGAVRQWLARSGVKTVGAAAREVDLRSIEGLILRKRAEEIMELVEKTKTEFHSDQKDISGEI